MGQVKMECKKGESEKVKKWNKLSEAALSV